MMTFACRTVQAQAVPGTIASGATRHLMRARAKTFADRLTPVVPREEADISHLSDEMADILYPGRRPRPFRMGLVFDAFEGPDYPHAVELARVSSVYREVREGDRLRHRAAFTAGEAALFRDLYDIVGGRPGTDVLVDEKKAPYAREIWMPLFFLHLSSNG